MVRELSGQMSDIFSDKEDFQPLKIMPDDMLTEALPDPNAPEYKEMRKRFVQDVAKGAITSPITAPADIVEMGGLLPDLPEGTSGLMPTYNIIENTFDTLVNLGINRENAVDLIRETTGLELTGSAGEFLGEVVGLPSASSAKVLSLLPSIVKKYGNKAASNLDKIVDETAAIFKSASGGDDFDGMAPALSGSMQTTAPQIDSISDLPDTSISPTMIGANTPSGRRAIEEYEDYALDVTNEGLSEHDLFIMSGVYKGPDNKYRFELDTSNVKLNYEAMDEAGLLLEGSIHRNEPILLRDVLDFPELYKEYDSAESLAKPKPLGDIEVTFEDGVDFYGAYFAADDSIVIDAKYLDTLIDISSSANLAREESDFLSLLLHEVQHAVQRREDFVTGSAPESMYRSAAAQLGFQGIRNSDDVLKRTRAISSVDHDEMVMQRLRAYINDDTQPVGSDLDHMIFNKVLADMAMKKYSRVKYGPMDAVPMGMYRFTEKEVAEYFDDPKRIREIESLDVEKIYQGVMDAIHGIPEKDMKRILHPSVRASREYNELNKIKDVANLRYRRKYGELESRIVEFRFAERQRLKRLGYTPEQIQMAMAEMYPPRQAHINEYIASIDPEFTRGLEKVETFQGTQYIVPEEKALLEGTESINAALTEKSPLRKMFDKLPENERAKLPPQPDENRLFGYHGTARARKKDEPFFDINFARQNDQFLGEGFYFTLDPEIASEYSNLRAFRDFDVLPGSRGEPTRMKHRKTGEITTTDNLLKGLNEKGEPLGMGQNILRVDLSNLEKPYIVRTEQQRRNLKKLIPQLKEKGYDSILFADFKDRSKQVMVFPEHMDKIDDTKINYSTSAVEASNIVEPLEIGTSPATEGGALLANYTSDTIRDVVEKAKNATVGLNKELIGKPVDAGKQVAVRLNLNSTIPDAAKGLDKLQTLHDKTPNGTALSYLPFATVENVEFFVNQTGRRNIAAKIKGLDVKESTGKYPAMSVNGQYNPTRNVLEEMDDDVVEIGFRPDTLHLFIDMATGQAVKSADVATVIGNRVYAKGVTYMKKADAPKPKPASDGTPLESEVRYKFKKGGLVQ